MFFLEASGHLYTIFLSMYCKQLLPMPPKRNQLPTFLFVADVIMSGDPKAPPFIYTNEK
jgi:hypothetical protein